MADNNFFEKTVNRAEAVKKDGKLVNLHVAGETIRTVAEQYGKEDAVFATNDQMAILIAPTSGWSKEQTDAFVSRLRKWVVDLESAGHKPRKDGTVFSDCGSGIARIIPGAAIARDKEKLFKRVEAWITGDPVKKPTDPADTKKPTDPADTKKPTDPADTKKPTDPADTKKPTDPDTEVSEAMKRGMNKFRALWKQYE